jgi:hypothetical protein
VAGLGLAGQDGSGRVAWRVTREAIGPSRRCLPVELSTLGIGGGDGLAASVGWPEEGPHLGDLIRRLPDPKGSWPITDMPRRDLFPDRRRPLGDRHTMSHYEEGTSITHVDGRAHPPVRHRR